MFQFIDFIYLIQSDKHIVQYSIPDNAHYLLLQWSKNFTPVENSFHYPNSTWASGRNELYRRAKKLGNYRYFIFLDDDLDCQFSLQEFQELVTHYQPKRAVPFCPKHHWYKECVDPRFQIERVKYVDHMFLACRHDCIDEMLPYTTKFDTQNWWLSSEDACTRFHALHPGGTLRFNHLIAHNEQARPYPRNQEINGQAYVLPINKHYPYYHWSQRSPSFCNNKRANNE